jgi:UPF0755 protein
MCAKKLKKTITNLYEKFGLTNNELVFGLLLLFGSAFFIAEMRWSRLNNPEAISSDVPVHVYLNEDRTNLDSLNKILDAKGLIENQEEFYWAAQLFGWRMFREGHYLVDRGFSYDEFLSKLARGIQDPVSVTIFPGRSKGDIVNSVSSALQFDSLAFHRTITDSTFLDSLDLDPEDVIGRFYPNTYSVYWTNSPEAFFQRVLKEFNRAVVGKYQSRIDELETTVDDIITLASIIEWEATHGDEKERISGLYWNRLEQGMRLQSDPTINYAIGERRRILYEDYKIDHPYNTYLYRGLPPGPITNPSLSSIEAALYPEDHDYLYMVASPDGNHDFSETFEEHKRKSAEWRRWLQEQYRIKKQKEQERNSEE